MSNWQPIETAPHGQRSLVALHTDSGDEVHTLERRADGKFIYEGEPTFCQSFYFEPYAWMPIPEAP